MTKIFLLSLLLTFASVLPATAQSIHDPEGLWLTENERAAIYVKKCGEDKKQLCGYIDWIIEGGMQTDRQNPDPALRERALCGLQIVYGLRQDTRNPNLWKDGYIYKADDGDEYNAKAELTGPDTMQLRGYMGISLLGKTQTWRRVSADDYPRCE